MDEHGKTLEEKIEDRRILLVWGLWLILFYQLAVALKSQWQELGEVHYGILATLLAGFVTCATVSFRQPRKITQRAWFIIAVVGVVVFILGLLSESESLPEWGHRMLFYGSMNAYFLRTPQISSNRQKPEPPKTDDD